jgi:hypothetical protein
MIRENDPIELCGFNHVSFSEGFRVRSTSFETPAAAPAGFVAGSAGIATIGTSMSASNTGKRHMADTSMTQFRKIPPTLR